MTTTRTKNEIVEEFRIQTIKDAAIQVISRKGISGASMQEIADEAGIAKGTIYLYFRNQQQLLEAAVDEVLSRLLEQLTESLHARGKFAMRLESLIREHIIFFEEHRDLFRVHLSMKHPEGADSSSTRCDRAGRIPYQRYLGELTAFLQGAIDAGEIQEIPAERLALFLEEGLIAVLFTRLNEKKPMPIDEETAWMVSLICSGATRRRSRS